MEDGNSVGDVPDIPRRNEVSMTIPSLWSIASMIEPCLQSQSCASGTVVFHCAGLRSCHVQETTSPEYMSVWGPLTKSKLDL
jgi:hypothetical protein